MPIPCIRDQECDQDECDISSTDHKYCVHLSLFCILRETQITLLVRTMFGQGKSEKGLGCPQHHLLTSPFPEVLPQNQCISDFFRFISSVQQPGQAIIGMAWCFAVNEQFGETWHLLILIMCFSSCEEVLGRWMHKILHLSAPLLLLLFMIWYAKLCFMGCWERLRSKLMWFTHGTFNKKRGNHLWRQSDFTYLFLLGYNIKMGSGQRPNISLSFSH